MTFHASNVLLQQKYWERRFTRYSELISCLLVAEQNNELLLKNHQSCPTRSMSLLEVNATSIQTLRHGQWRGYGRGQGRGCGQGRDKHNSSHRSGSQSKNNNSNHQKWNNSKAQPERGIEPQSKHARENKCHRCGMKGHWSRTCCTLNILLTFIKPQ